MLKTTNVPGRLYRLCSNVFYYFIAAPIIFLITRLFMGVRVRGKIKREIKRQSAVIVCNHVHMLDSALAALTIFPRRPLIPALPKNVDTIFPGFLVRLLGGVSIPRDLSEVKPFFDDMARFIKDGRIIIFFPEGELSPYDNGLRNFRKGAFRLAARTRVSLIPIAISFRPPKGIGRLFRRKPVMLVNIGEAIAASAVDEKEDAYIRMEAVRAQMNEMIKRSS